MSEATTAALDAFIEAIAERVADKMEERSVKTQPEPLPDNTTFTPEEAAEYLRCSVATIYRRTNSGEIPCFYNGQRKFIHKRELDKWTEKGGSQ